MAVDVRYPKCGGMVRIRRHFKWKLAGTAIGSTIGWAAGSLGLTFLGLTLTPVVDATLFGLMGLEKGTREDSTGLCPHCNGKIDLTELRQCQSVHLINNAASFALSAKSFFTACTMPSNNSSKAEAFFCRASNIWPKNSC